MEEPTISYTSPRIFDAIEGQPIHSDAQYLLLKAGIGNGAYASREFVEAIDGVSFDEVTKGECRRNIELHRDFMLDCAGRFETVTITDFHPDVRELGEFVNTTFREMYERFMNKVNCPECKETIRKKDYANDLIWQEIPFDEWRLS